MEISKGKVAAGDIDIAYTAVGSGKPLIVVHGGPGIGPGYLRGLDAWADEFQVVYYDQRGCGETELGDPDKVSFKGHIDDLDAVRAGLGMEKANLVGQSAGAHLAMLFAAHRAETTGSLVLLNSAPPLVPDLQDRLWANMAARRTAEDDAEKQEIEGSAEFQARDPKTLERYYTNMYLPFFRDRNNTTDFDMGFTEITAANVLQAWERTFSDIEELDPLGSLSQISCPTLVVHGEHDPVPEEWARFVVDNVRGCQYALLAGCNHFAHLEDPEVLANAVKPFLRNHVV
ncbi:MAG: alpha/beta hydrolase [Actinomycetota bacterium]|nr:alpha/beta hydrolase [Actinomycetota bacterium]